MIFALKMVKWQNRFEKLRDKNKQEKLVNAYRMYQLYLYIPYFRYIELVAFSSLDKVLVFDIKINAKSTRNSQGYRC